MSLGHKRDYRLLVDADDLNRTNFGYAVLLVLSYVALVLVIDAIFRWCS
jgi:hypothetical protein